MFGRSQADGKNSPDPQSKTVGEENMRKDNIQINNGARSMIGTKVVIKGDIFSEEDLTIEGQVEGTVTAKNNEVHVGSAGKLKATIQAKNVRVEGTLSGEIRCSEAAVIAASANVQGNISAPRVILEDGAKFKGTIDMDGAEKPAPAASVKPAQPAAAKVGA